MKKIVVLICMVTLIFIQACSSGGGGSDPGQNPENSNYFSLNVSVAGNGTVSIPGVTLQEKNKAVSLAALPDNGWIFDHWDGDLTGNSNPALITMDSDKTVTAVFTLEGDPVTPVDPIDNITIEQTKSVLYAAYAGIGYKGLNSTDDDEMLYRINFRDINELAGKYVSTSLLYVLFMGKKFDYSFQNSTAHFEITSGTVLDLMNLATEIEFRITVDMSGKVTNDDVVFSGRNSNDLVIDVTVKGSSTFNGTTVIIKNFTVTTGNRLKSVYKSPKTAEVIYNSFRLSYFLNENSVNCFTLPQGSFESEGQNGTDRDETPDLRHYSLNGALSINNENYYWDMKYSQFDYKKLNPVSTNVYISMKGRIAIPGMSGYAEITSPGYDVMTDYLTDETGIASIVLSDLQDSIKRNATGKFTAGSLSIKPHDESIQSSFNSDGSLKIGNSVTINSWQDSLNPLK